MLQLESHCRIACAVVALLATSPIALSQDETTLVVSGTISQGFYGQSVAGIGDLDGDGYVEIAVGIPGASQVEIINAVTGSLLGVLVGETPNDGFGGSVVDIGDFDGDGKNDFAVAAQYNDAGGVNAGRVYVYSGNGAVLLATLTGESAGDRFGYSIGAAGDVDGDGTADIVVGAPYHDQPHKIDAGRAYVFVGPNGLFRRSLDGESRFDLFGSAVGGIQDIGNDGRDDLVIGARWADSVGPNQGRVYVFDSETAAVAYVIDGENGGDQLGHVLATLADINGDGAGDVLLGSMQNDHGGVPNIGRAYLHCGRTGQLIRVHTGLTPHEHFGASVANVGDVNVDGVTDYAIGGPLHLGTQGVTAGRIYVHDGRDGSLLYDREGDAHLDFFGGSIANAGDVNGDGFPELVTSAFGFDGVVLDSGRAYVLTHPDHGPFLGPSAAGSVGIDNGGPYDVISIDGDTGGVSRRVERDGWEPFNFVVVPPPGSAGMAPFVIFGKFAAPVPQESVPLLPPLFGLSFLPSFLAPNDSTLFTFAGTLIAGLLPARPAPDVFVFPIGLPSGSTTTLQGLIVDGTDLRTTNGLILRIN